MKAQENTLHFSEHIEESVLDKALISSQLFDELREEALASPRLRMNRDMRTSSSDTSQRMLNALELGTVLPIHRHRTTTEAQILLRGKIDVMFYDDSGKEIRRFHLDPLSGNYGVNIPVGMWHSLEVLESGSVIFEAKDGKYEPIGEDDVLRCKDA